MKDCLQKVTENKKSQITCTICTEIKNLERGEGGISWDYLQRRMKNFDFKIA